MPLLVECLDSPLSKSVDVESHKLPQQVTLEIACRLCGFRVLQEEEWLVFRLHKQGS